MRVCVLACFSFKPEIYECALQLYNNSSECEQLCNYRDMTGVSSSVKCLSTRTVEEGRTWADELHNISSGPPDSGINGQD